MLLLGNLGPVGMLSDVEDWIFVMLFKDLDVARSHMLGVNECCLPLYEYVCVFRDTKQLFLEDQKTNSSSSSSMSSGGIIYNRVQISNR